MRSSLAFSVHAICLALAVTSSGACLRTPGKAGAAVVVHGQVVSAETLDEGAAIYAQYCALCHGEHGDGRGPAAVHMVPPPRSFTTGHFKVARAGGLPTDEELLDVLIRGVPGTAMLPVRIGEGKQRAVIQHLKTLSPRWGATKLDRVVELQSRR